MANAVASSWPLEAHKVKAPLAPRICTASNVMECEIPLRDKGKGKAVRAVHLDEGYSSSQTSLTSLVNVKAQAAAGGDDDEMETSPVVRDTGSPDLDELGEVGWTKYEPPKALFLAKDVESEIISEILNSSIQNIKRQVERLNETAAQQDGEEGKGKEKADDAGTTLEVNNLARLPSSAGSAESNPGAARSSTEENKRRSANFARRLLRHVHGTDRGESSAVGAVMGMMDRSGHARSVSHDGPLQTTGPSLAATIIVAAAVAQPTQRSPSKPSFFNKLRKDKVAETVECVSCFEDVPTKISVKTICHSYCKECFGRLVTAAIDNEAQWPPKCCLNNIPVRVITKHVPGDLAKRYIAKASEFNIPVAERLYCPVADCGVFIPRARINRAERTATCSAGHWVCTICRAGAHGRETCLADTEARQTAELATEEGWRRCHQCGILVEHGEACQHMTCRCGAEFCYVCGRVWRSCACSMEDLCALKEQVAQRRVARENLASEEERELREALALIEQFEREEESRVAEYRVELDRLAEESRRLARKERELREKGRLLDVTRKYQAERAVLEAVAKAQSDLLLQTHADETERFSQKLATEAYDSAAAAAAQLSSRCEDARRALHDCETAWAADFNARVRVERRLEAHFLEKLSAAVRTEGGRSRAETALQSYMQRNDDRLAAYKKWRDAEVERVRQLAEEELAVREEVASVEAARASEEARARQREHRRRQLAERKWAELVGAERRRLLEEMESVEKENGGEPLSDEEPELATTHVL